MLHHGFFRRRLRSTSPLSSLTHTHTHTHTHLFHLFDELSIKFQSHVHVHLVATHAFSCTKKTQKNGHVDPASEAMT